MTDTSKQSYSNIETIIITDYEHKGQCWARNRGFEKASGDYVLFLDDDLIISDQIAEKLFKALEGTNHSFSYCNYHIDGKREGGHYANNWNFEELKKFNYISSCSMVVKKDFCGWDEKLNRLVDWDVWLTMGENGKTGVWVNEYLFTAFYYDGCISLGDDYEDGKAKVMAKHNL